MVSHIFDWLHMAKYRNGLIIKSYSNSSSIQMDWWWPSPKVRTWPMPQMTSQHTCTRGTTWQKWITPKHPSADWLCDPMRKSHLPRRSFALLPRRETCGPRRSPWSPWSMRGSRSLWPAYGKVTDDSTRRGKHRKAKHNKHTYIISICIIYTIT